VEEKAERLELHRRGFEGFFFDEAKEPGKAGGGEKSLLIR
jgi:hypothetical protein